MNTWIHTLVINIFYEAIVIKTAWTGTKAEIQINGKNRRPKHDFLQLQSSDI